MMQFKSIIYRFRNQEFIDYPHYVIDVQFLNFFQCFFFVKVKIASNLSLSPQKRLKLKKKNHSTIIQIFHNCCRSSLLIGIFLHTFYGKNLDDK